MRTQISKSNFIDDIFIAVGLCVLISGLFWAFFQDNQKAKEFLGVFGTIVTIVGFGIGLWQLAQLRREKEIIIDTKILDKIDDVKELLQEAQNEFINEITIDLLKSILNTLKKVKNKILFLKIHKCDHIIFDDFDSKIDEIFRDFQEIINSPEGIKVIRISLYQESIDVMINSITQTEYYLTVNTN